MDSLRRYGNIFKFDGTNQLQRMPIALEHNYIVPDERSFRDLLVYAKKLAGELRYYNLTGQTSGDWRPFFELLTDPATGEILSQSELQNKIDNNRDWPPHVALVLVFLKLYTYLQEDLNQITVRHLRHYYEEQLGLQLRELKVDQAHIIFELAKNASSKLLATGTELDAGKDGNGNSLTYVTSSDIVVTPASITDIYRLIKDTDKRLNPRFFKSNTISELEGESWHTFGRKQLDYDNSQRFMQEAELGFAIGSPILFMAEGTRVINLVLDLSTSKDNFPADHNIGFALRAEISGDEGWIKPGLFSAEIINSGIDKSSIKINLTIEESDAAIVACNSELHDSGPDSEWPVIRFILDGQSGHYNVLEGLAVTNCRISIDVIGVKNLLVQNEHGSLNVEKPMALFGRQPRVGSEFFIGSGEIFSKRLSFFALNMEWLDYPADLFNYYREYFDLETSGLEDNFASNFILDVHMLYKRIWNEPLLNSQHLIDFSDRENRTLAIPLEDQSFVNNIFGENKYQPHYDILNLEKYDNFSKYGFVKFVLKGPTYAAPEASEIPFEAFGHKAFATRYANKAIELSQWTTGNKPELPNSPYTPTISNLSINYKASIEFTPGDNQALEQFFTVDAFGYYEANNEVAASIVPGIDDQAYLFIGLKNLSGPVNISLLFQLDKGTTTTTNEALESGETQWSYLAYNKWQMIPSSGVLNDSTFGFQNPGIISLVIGDDASTRHSLMPDNLLWLRAAISKPADSVCRTIDLHNNAILVELSSSFDNLDNYDEHLSLSLPENTISKLKKRNAAIKKVSQPYASFGGLGKEQDINYFQTSSERLRHRNRAVTVWDIERLVLNTFPEVFKVKCLPHSDADANRKVGELAVVIVPDLRSVSTINPIEPQADTVLMRKIENYLLQQCSSFSVINIIHPLFEYIKVDAHIAFHSGVDAGYFSQVLNDDLQRFLSPWAYEDGQDIVFGSRIYRSEILAFIEGREYVDYVTKFVLYHIYDGQRRDGVSNMIVDFDFLIRPTPTPNIQSMEIGEDYIVGQGIEVAETTRPHAILVSHSEHQITPIAVDDNECSGVEQLGIGYMTVSLDFNVTP